MYGARVVELVVTSNASQLMQKGTRELVVRCFQVRVEPDVARVGREATRWPIRAGNRRTHHRVRKRKGNHCIFTHLSSIDRTRLFSDKHGVSTKPWYRPWKDDVVVDVEVE